jgi:hypothetical protein
MLAKAAESGQRLSWDSDLGSMVIDHVHPLWPIDV